MYPESILIVDAQWVTSGEDRPLVIVEPGLGLDDVLNDDGRKEPRLLMSFATSFLKLKQGSFIKFSSFRDVRSSTGDHTITVISGCWIFRSLLFLVVNGT